MLASHKVRRIVTRVVRIHEQPKPSANRYQNVDHECPSSFQNPRPSDLLPWADPYISQLVRKLQDEVRGERLQLHQQRSTTTSPLAEMQPPNPHMVLDWKTPQEKRSSFQSNPPKDGNQK